LDSNKQYGSLWFDNQEDLDRYDSLMRKKIYFQNTYGEKNDKEFTLDGFKTTFGIFSKDYAEKVFTRSKLAASQFAKVRIFNKFLVRRY